MEDKEFTEGQEVEIQGGVFNKDPDSWYTAKVIEFLNNNMGKMTKKKTKKIRIEYERLMDKQGLRMRESVDGNQVRPPPPLLSCTFFQVNQLVDAFFANGWWKGKITGILGVSSYAVLMFSSDLINPQTEVRFDDLRVHQDWIGGRWVIPLSQHYHQDINTKCNRGDVDKTDETHLLHVYNTLWKDIANESNTSKTKTKGSAPKSDIKFSPPCKKSKNGEATEDSLSRIAPTRAMPKLSSLTTKGERAPSQKKKKKCQKWIDTFSQEKIRTVLDFDFSMKGFGGTEIKQQMEGVEKESNVILGRTGGQSDGMVSEATSQMKTDKYRKLKDILQIPPGGLRDPPPRMKTDKYWNLTDIFDSDHRQEQK